MDAPRFSDLARLLRALDGRQSEKPPTKASRFAMLQAFFQRYLPTGTDTRTVRAVFALLLPAEDDRRYHLKESRLAQAVVTALGLGGSSAAQRLLEWQDPAAGEEEEEHGHGRGEAQGCGDLSALVAAAVKERVGTGREPLSATDVHAGLDNLADGDQEPPPTHQCACGRGACAVFTAKTPKNAGRRFFLCPAARDGGCKFFQWCGETPLDGGGGGGGGGGALPRMLRRCSAVEAQWLVRIILRDVRIGAEACGHDTKRAEWPRLVMEAFRGGMYRFYLRQRDLPAAATRAELARRAHAAAPGAAAAVAAARACAAGTGVAVAPAGWAGAAQLGAASCSLDPRVQHGVYVSVMLSKPCTSADAPAKAFGAAKELMLETKHDGERIQLHLWRDPGPNEWPTDRRPACRRGGVSLRIFSRGGNDSTFRRALALPALALALGHDLSGELGGELGGELAAEIGPPEHALLRRRWRERWGGAAARSGERRDRDRVRSCILDGEIVVFDEALHGEGRGGVEPFTTRGGVQGMAPNKLGPRRSALDGGLRHLMVVWFDVIECNGEDFLYDRTPLQERKSRLREIVREVPHFVEVAESRAVRAGDRGALLAAVAEVTRRRQEGLVLKRADSPYVPNGRGDWLKLKTQVIPGLGDTISVGLIGGRFGSGHVHGGRLAEFCFGALINGRAVAERGEAPQWAWLFNSAVGLPWESARRLSDDCLGVAVAVARMRRVEYSDSAPLPGWLQFAPRAGATRLHCVLRHPEWALPTDVWGQRFLPSGGGENSGAAAHFLRFPVLDKVRGSSCGGWRGCISLQEYREVGERYQAPPSEREVRRVCEGVSAGRGGDDDDDGDDGSAAHQPGAMSPSSSAVVPPKRAAAAARVAGGRSTKLSPTSGLGLLREPPPTHGAAARGVAACGAAARPPLAPRASNVRPPSLPAHRPCARPLPAGVPEGAQHATLSARTVAGGALGHKRVRPPSPRTAQAPAAAAAAAATAAAAAAKRPRSAPPCATPAG